MTTSSKPRRNYPATRKPGAGRPRSGKGTLWVRVRLELIAALNAAFPDKRKRSAFVDNALTEKLNP